MKWFKDTLTIQTRGKGLYPFTPAVENRLGQWGVTDGMCYLFIPHTSASLVISENFDPTAKNDLEAFMESLVPEDESWHRHTLEGSDDSPSHIRAMLTQTSLTVPVDAGKLSLGTWQGLYVFEHRTRGHQRQVELRCFDIL